MHGEQPGYEAIPGSHSFTERVLHEISGACVDTKPRGNKATCIVSGDRG